MMNPSSREAARTLLKRMAKDREIKHQVTKYMEMDNLWMLPTTHKIKEGKFSHDQAGAWLYVRLQPLFEKWGMEIPVGAGLVADRAMDIRGQRYWIEVDMGNEEPEQLKAKIDGYIGHAEYPSKTLFVLESGKYPAKATLSRIMEYVNARKRGNQFLGVYYKSLLDDPTGNVLYSPLTGYTSFEAVGATH